MIYPKVKKRNVNQFLNNPAANIVKEGLLQGLRIGERYNGGVIFHLWLDSEGKQHGLIVEDVALRETQVLSANQANASGGTSFIDGKANTNSFISLSTGASAIKTIFDSTEGGYDDWYLPSVQEMLTLYTNLYEVNKTLTNKITSVIYWTSTEVTSGNAYNFNMLTSSAVSTPKSSATSPIGIRSF
jgi:hypothetical protein